MVRFGVIGTNWITEKFIEGAHASGKMQLTGVYSRKMDRAKEFAAKFSVDHSFDSLEEMAASDMIDAVYIASPNSFHAPQAKLFIENGKHVIGEKPLASNIHEIESLIALAQEKDVVLFEALKTTYNPNFKILQQALPKLGKLRKVHFTYCQHSSRYQKFLNGENPNTFNPKFSNGSLMDIGIYPLSVAIGLFGEPKSFTAQGVLLHSGVDAHGTLVLHYDDFDAVISHSKVSNGYAPSELQGEQASILIESISECETVSILRQGEPAVVLSQDQGANTMQYEADVFADLIETKQTMHAGLDRTCIVSAIITRAREIIGVRFPADEIV
ncbi:Gfo/Idh/MocA family protein [Photobacterium indicum]|uniref:Gfo/Idh/MocA family protein n=1 Tax=Photobacterium indicum TaxID=81447 RepID=UPI003D0ACF1C